MKGSVRRRIFLLGAILFLLAGCKPEETTGKVETTKPQEPSTSAEEKVYTPGVYEGEAEGYGGTLRVEVEVDEESILSVEVLEHSERRDVVLQQIPQDIIENQSVNVEAVSGATVTSKAIRTAATQALIKAGADNSILMGEREDKEKTEVTPMEADVVVVGAGGAGIAAAVTAAENGAKVLILEKTSEVGGATARGEGFFAADSNQSRELGQDPLDTDYLFRLWMEETEWQVDAILVRQFLELSHTTANWLEAHGLKFHKEAASNQPDPVEGTHGYHKYDDFTATKAQLSAMLQTVVDNKEAKILYNTKATKLLTEGDTVVGVMAEGSGNTYEIKSKSVILCTGGFVGNNAMVKEALGGVDVNAAGYNTNVGEGISMGRRIGGATVGMEVMLMDQLHLEGSESVKGDYSLPEKNYATRSLIHLPAVLWVNSQGVRFANEGIIYNRILTANSLVSQGGKGYWIYSQTMLDKLEAKGAAALGVDRKVSIPPYSDIAPLDKGWSKLTEIVNQMVENKTVLRGETIEELAEALNMKGEVLAETLQQYEEAVAVSKDALYGKRANYLHSLGEGPYYAFVVTVDNRSTLGGLRINRDFQVVLDAPDKGYVPVKNLYAAGSDAGGIYSGHYPYLIEGAAQGWAYNSGRLAGARATENALNILIELK